VNRVTADSNILVSAFLRGGKPLELVELGRARSVELASTEDILNETGRVLRTKFGVPAEDVQEYQAEIRSRGVRSRNRRLQPTVEAGSLVAAGKTRP
jgi:hypothetical protein